MRCNGTASAIGCGVMVGESLHIFCKAACPRFLPSISIPPCLSGVACLSTTVPVSLSARLRSSATHEVTLGGTGKERGDRHPKVRDGVLLCAGAKVLGNVEIGRDAKVGAGSVVLQDVPPGATVAGVPARIVGWSSGSVPALEMDQSLPDYEI